METLILAFVFLQTLGAIGGAGAVVWGELTYLRAMRDGKIDKAERAHLDAIAAALRFGMLLILLSSLGLIIASYVVENVRPPAVTASYWALMLLALIIVWTSWALSRKRVTFSYGSAIIFSGWWFLVYLTLGWLQPLSFLALILTFVVITAVFYAFLTALRTLALHKK